MKRSTGSWRVGASARRAGRRRRPARRGRSGGPGAAWSRPCSSATLGQRDTGAHARRGSAGRCSRKASLSTALGVCAAACGSLPSSARPSCSSASNSVATNSRVRTSIAAGRRRRRRQGRPIDARDPGEVGVGARQHVRLLVVEVLDAMLEAAQEGVGLGQPARGLGLHHADRRPGGRARSAWSACGSPGTGRRAPPAATAR